MGWSPARLLQVLQRNIQLSLVPKKIYDVYFVCCMNIPVARATETTQSICNNLKAILCLSLRPGKSTRRLPGEARQPARSRPAPRWRAAVAQAAYLGSRGKLVLVHRRWGQRSSAAAYIWRRRSADPHRVACRARPFTRALPRAAPAAPAAPAATAPPPAACRGSPSCSNQFKHNYTCFAMHHLSPRYLNRKRTYLPKPWNFM